MKTSKIIWWYFFISFCVWWVFLAAYGGSHTDVRQSPLYNTEKQEIRTAFVYAPVIALLWPLWAVVFYGLCDWLPNQFSKKSK